jgi:hypothetical protein
MIGMDLGLTLAVAVSVPDLRELGGPTRDESVQAASPGPSDQNQLS